MVMDLPDPIRVDMVTFNCIHRKSCDLNVINVFPFQNDVFPIHNMQNIALSNKLFVKFERFFIFQSFSITFFL